VIALLLLANAGYFLWTQGHLAPLGLAPETAAEIAAEAMKSSSMQGAPVMLSPDRLAAVLRAALGG